jgi:hypothetical protein
MNSLHMQLCHIIQITVITFLSSISDMSNQKSYATIKTKALICFTLSLP